jgi:5-methylcytosine-specific restriction endonuclease McrA
MAERTCRHCETSFAPLPGRGRPRQWCYDCLPLYGTVTDYNRQAVRLSNFVRTAKHGACCGLPRQKAKQSRPLPRPASTGRGSVFYQQLRAQVLSEETHCGFCGEPVDMTLSYPHRDSPSIDHIVPESLGGSHDRSNVRLAHFGCNARAGQALAGSLNSERTQLLRAALWLAEHHI